jgi:hypothetical protein
MQLSIKWGKETNKQTKPTNQIKKPRSWLSEVSSSQNGHEPGVVNMAVKITALTLYNGSHIIIWFGVYYEPPH